MSASKDFDLCPGTAAAVSPCLRDIYAEAKKNGCLYYIQQGFREEYLEEILKANESSTSAKVLEMLQFSILAHDSLKEVEKKMNVDNFVKRVCAGHWEISGSSGGFPILWVRAGIANSGLGGFGSRRGLREGTQEWYSALRSSIFLFESFARKRLSCKVLPTRCVMCFDLRGQGFLDGHLKFERTLVGYLEKLFPAAIEERFFIFGLSPVVAACFNAANKFTPRRKKYGFMSRPDQATEIAEIAENRSPVPKWLLEFNANAETVNPDQIWGLDRFLNENEAVRVEHADIFNPRIAQENAPGEMPKEVLNESAVRPERETESTECALETIEEEPEEIF